MPSKPLLFPSYSSSSSFLLFKFINISLITLFAVTSALTYAAMGYVTFLPVTPLDPMRNVVLSFTPHGIRFTIVYRE